MIPVFILSHVYLGRMCFFGQKQGQMVGYMTTWAPMSNYDRHGAFYWCMTGACRSPRRDRQLSPPSVVVVA